MAFLLLAVASPALIGIIIWTRRKHDGMPPPALCALNLLLTTGTGAVTVIPFAYAFTSHSGNAMAALMSLCLGLVILLPPIVLAASDCAQVIGGWMAATLYDSSVLDPPPSTFGRANACVQRNDVPGALKEFRNYFSDNPKSPAPLFAAARVLEAHQLYRAAVQHYQEIADRFERQDPIWAEALLRMADVYTHYLDDRRKAEGYLRQIIQRARHLEQGKAAHQRLVP